LPTDPAGNTRSLKISASGGTSGPGNSIIVLQNQPFTLTTQASDPRGNPDHTYGDTVAFAVQRAVPANLPGYTAFTSSDSGVVVSRGNRISHVGAFVIYAADMSNPGINGTSNLIYVEPNPRLTATGTPTPFGSETPTLSSTPTPLPSTHTFSLTPSASPSPTYSWTGTSTLVETGTISASAIPSSSPSLTWTPSPSETDTSLPSVESTQTMALTATISPTVTPTFGCAFTDGQNADIVLGQTNFASNTVLNPPTQASLYFPDGIATDGSNLYVCDTANSRVMEFNLATLSNGANATAEVGQANFVTQGSSGGPPYYLDGPTSDYCDGTTLYVSDASKDCVLGFKLPISTAAPAAFELGTVGVSSDDSLTMAGPMGIAEYQNGASSQLYVADSSNNRVMVYGSSSALPNGWPLSSGQPASWVIGQTGFGENSPNQGNPSPSANTLSSPFALYCDGTNLYVADAGNERVLIFPVPITGFNASASSAVIGQANANSVVNTFPAPYVLDEPWGLAGDGNYLYVDDYQLNRVLIFNLPITASLPSASTVLGQANFSSSASGDTASTLSTPEGMCSVNGSIYVSDCDNSRMLGYLCTVGDPPPERTRATEDPLVVSISENPLIPYL